MTNNMSIAEVVGNLVFLGISVIIFRNYPKEARVIVGLKHGDYKTLAEVLKIDGEYHLFPLDENMVRRTVGRTREQLSITSLVCGGIDEAMKTLQVIPPVHYQCMF